MTNFYMTVGLSGSAKSSWAQDIVRLEDAEWVSSDNIRKEMWGSEDDQREPAKVFAEMARRTKSALYCGRTVVYDATNLNSKKRKALLDAIINIPNVYFQCRVFLVPVGECILRDAQRNRSVGKDVIYRQLSQFEVPLYSEGWDNIQFDLLCDYVSRESIEDLMKGFDQDNPHHEYDLYTHCKMTAQPFSYGQPKADAVLWTSAMLHDYGKMYTKTFTNMKGEEGEVAHYYGHQNVGAYLSFFVNDLWSIEDKVERAILIQYHMALYQPSEKAQKRVRDRIGERLYWKLLDLHEADVAAH